LPVPSRWFRHRFEPSGDAADHLLEARRITAGYGRQPVIHEIDMIVKPGEVVALLGANGSGRTTTLLALSGELPLMAGVVHLYGRPTTASLQRRARNGVGFVTEKRSVFMGLTAMENLRLGTRDPKAAIELFPDLGERLNVRAGLLSGGEQQMLTLARALSRQPRLLLADELSLGLAPLIVKRLLGEVRAAADAGCGVLLVEQHVRHALAHADRAYVMRRGRIEIEGSAAQILARMDEIEATYLHTAVDHAAPRPR
jgi:branched-chain amino acid transport system ATP-binding protein